MSDERSMTAQEAFRSVGKWVAIRPDLHPAILIRARGTAVLCRDAGSLRHKGSKHHYGWYALESVIRREDWDAWRPLPEWFEKAIEASRTGKRLSLDLQDAVNAHVNPQYTTSALTTDEALDELVYRSYRQQRRLSPDVTPERWARIFDNVDAMERRYQEELELEAEIDALDESRPVFDEEHPNLHVHWCPCSSCRQHRTAAEAR